MVLRRLLPGARMRSSTSDPVAPLVIRFAALGDVVLLTVLLEALHQRYGRPVHVLGSGPWTSVLLEGHPAVGDVRLLSSRRAPYWLTPSQQSAAAWLRQHRGPIYLCDPDDHAARFLQRAGVPEGRLLRAWQHWPGDGIHWADWWLQIAALDAADVPGPAVPITVPALPRLQAPAAWHEDARAWLQAQGLAGHPLVLVQPGHKKTHKRGRLATAGHDKHWPAERWAEVVRGVAGGLPGAAVLVCGSPREAGLAQEIVDAAGAVPAGHAGGQRRRPRPQPAAPGGRGGAGAQHGVGRHRSGPRGRCDGLPAGGAVRPVRLGPLAAAGAAHHGHPAGPAAAHTWHQGGRPVGRRGAGRLAPPAASALSLFQVGGSRPCKGGAAAAPSPAHRVAICPGSPALLR